FQILTLLTPTDLSATVPPPPLLQQLQDAWHISQGSLDIVLYRKNPRHNLTSHRQIRVKLAS
ncbi:MAG: hypothetical protein FWD61_13770, partial [Phycisphaerales bacterium]|nr:hypothetical protein [Phycisphaerales bacterium]